MYKQTTLAKPDPYTIFCLLDDFALTGREQVQCVIVIIHRAIISCPIT
jgi:hypothetical protein